MSDLRVEVDGHVALWTISRAERRNTVGGTLLREILEAGREAAADDTIRAVVTAAEGSTWCVGADLRDMEPALGSTIDELLASDIVGGEKGLPRLSAEEQAADVIGVGRWVEAFWALEKPLIAAVNGPVAGGGLGLCVLYDVRIASPRASFTSGFVKLGVGPEMGLTHLLPRIVGWSVATDVLLAGDTLSADEARAAGLVREVVDGEKLLASACDYADRLAALPPLGVQATVRALRASLTRGLTDQFKLEWENQRRTFVSADMQRAVRALVTGVPATYEGR